MLLRLPPSPAAHRVPSQLHRLQNHKLLPRSEFISPPPHLRRRRQTPPLLLPLRAISMAMQASMGLSKVILLLGAGFTGSIALRNGRLSDILTELQEMLKDKSGEGGDGEHAEALATQVRRLAMEIRQLASARPITVLNGNGGQGGNVTSLLVPAATLGAVGYGYMWWKGLSFSDLMYVTKQNMSNAVSSMTKHLEQVSAALAATKKHLTQRIENLDWKLDEQKAISSEIKNEVLDARDKLTDIGYNLNSLQQLVYGLDEKVNTIEEQQDFTCRGVRYLCHFVGAQDGKVPTFLQDGPKTTNRRFLGSTETNSLKGLQHLTEVIESGNFSKFKADEIFPNDINSLNKLQCLPRPASLR